jgi:hypothetical protein
VPSHDQPRLAEWAMFLPSSKLTNGSFSTQTLSGNEFYEKAPLLYSVLTVDRVSLARSSSTASLENSTCTIPDGTRPQEFDRKAHWTSPKWMSEPDKDISHENADYYGEACRNKANFLVRKAPNLLTTGENAGSPTEVDENDHSTFHYELLDVRTSEKAEKGLPSLRFYEASIIPHALHFLQLMKADPKSYLDFGEEHITDQDAVLAVSPALDKVKAWLQDPESTFSDGDQHNLLMRDRIAHDDAGMNGVDYFIRKFVAELNESDNNAPANNTNQTPARTQIEVANGKTFQTHFTDSEDASNCGHTARTFWHLFWGKYDDQAAVSSTNSSTNSDQTLTSPPFPPAANYLAARKECLWYSHDNTEQGHDLTCFGTTEIHEIIEQLRSSTGQEKQSLGVVVNAYSAGKPAEMQGVSHKTGDYDYTHTFFLEFQNGQIRLTQSWYLYFTLAEYWNNVEQKELKYQNHSLVRDSTFERMQAEYPAGKVWQRAYSGWLSYWYSLFPTWFGNTFDIVRFYNLASGRQEGAPYFDDDIEYDKLMFKVRVKPAPVAED